MVDLTGYCQEQSKAEMMVLRLDSLKFVWWVEKMVEKMVLNMDLKQAEKLVDQKGALLVDGMVVWKVLTMVGSKDDWLVGTTVGLMVGMTDAIMAAQMDDSLVVLKVIWKVDCLADQMVVEMVVHWDFLLVAVQVEWKEKMLDDQWVAKMEQ